MPASSRYNTNQPTAGNGRWLRALFFIAAAVTLWTIVRKTSATTMDPKPKVDTGKNDVQPPTAREQWRPQPITIVRLIAVVLILDGLALLGFMPESFALLKASQAKTQGQFTTGTVALNLTNYSGSFTGTISNLAPGDVVQVATKVGSTSTLASGIKLTTTATGSQILFDHVAAGGTPIGDELTLKVDKCTVPWTGTSPNMSCSGSPTTILATTTIKQTNTALAGLNVAGTGAQSDELRFTLTLPSSGNGADNQNQNKTTTVTFTFVATQRSATGF